MENKKILTLEEARESLNKQGLSIRKFANMHKVSTNLVQSILRGNVKYRIGKSHKIAVLLGLKQGE